MKHSENLKLKTNSLNELYQMVYEYNDTMKINDFYSIDTISNIWGNVSYFILDFKKFAPHNLQFKSIQKKGSFVKVMNEVSSAG